MMLCMTGWDNEPLSSLTHFIGALLSAAGLALLVVFAALKGTVWHVVGFTLFGASLILLYGASTLYHVLPFTSKAKAVMKRVDHAMIYVLIAGTYTPICLITLRGAWGWTLFGIIWAFATVGVFIKAFDFPIKRWVSTALYILMGWLALIAFYPLIQALSIGGIFWLVLGGVFYTAGAFIFSFDEIKLWKHFSMHDVWHLFVMAGSFCHFWLMLRYVL
jgi:hemolysin III